MNKQISWDQSLIKKYSSSNHFKLLNQLRDEVIMYPLNKNKNIQNSTIKDNKLEGNSKSFKEISQDINVTKTFNNNNEVDIKKSNVSFNNSKNFSIYNSSINSINEQKENNLSTINKSHNNAPSSTFNERLNKVELK